MLDDRVRAVLGRLEAEDAEEREQGVSRELRGRQVARSTGQFLFALVAPQVDCEVLELGGSRGYSSIWFAAGVRHLGGRVLSLEADPAKVQAWRRNVAEAGLEETAELIEGDAFETLPQIEDVFDIVFIDAEKEDYERLFQLARDKVEPGGLFVADNVLSHADPLAEYSKARQADPTLESVTVPLDRGLELKCGPNRPFLTSPGTWSQDVSGMAYVLSERLQLRQPRKGGGPACRFQYGQWRYQRVEACPRDLRGIV